MARNVRILAVTSSGTCGNSVCGGEGGSFFSATIACFEAGEGGKGSPGGSRSGWYCVTQPPYTKQQNKGASWQQIQTTQSNVNTTLRSKNLRLYWKASSGIPLLKQYASNTV